MLMTKKIKLTSLQMTICDLERIAKAATPCDSTDNGYRHSYFVCAFCLSLGRVATHRTYENCVNEEEERFLQNEHPLYYCC